MIQSTILLYSHPFILHNFHTTIHPSIQVPNPSIHPSIHIDFPSIQMHPSSHPAIHSSTYLSIHSSIHPLSIQSIILIFLPPFRSIHSLIIPSIYLSIHSSIHSINHTTFPPYKSIHSSIHSSIHPSIYPNHIPFPPYRSICQNLFILQGQQRIKMEKFHQEKNACSHL